MNFDTVFFDDGNDPMLSTLVDAKNNPKANYITLPPCDGDGGLVIDGTCDTVHNIYMIGDKKIILTKGKPAPFTDLFIVKHEGLFRVYNCSKVDMIALAKDIGCQGNEYCVVTAVWPFKQYDTSGLFEAIIHHRHAFTLGQSFAIIPVNEIKKIWLDNVLINTLGLIFAKYQMIAFEIKKGDSYEYTFVHNGRYEKYNSEEIYDLDTNNAVVVVPMDRPIDSK